MYEEKIHMHELLEYAKTRNIRNNIFNEEAIQDCFDTDNNALVVLQVIENYQRGFE